MADEVIVDVFSSMDHKVGMGPTAGGIDAAPDWLDDFQKRRINFAIRVRAYLATVARFYLPEVDDDDSQGRSPLDWRELGDAPVIARRVGTSVLGDLPVFGIVGSDDPVPDEPDLPPVPQEPRDSDPEPLRAFKQRVYTEQVNRWNVQAEEAFTEWLDQLDSMPRIRSVEAWLQNWAEKERLQATILENETEHIVPIGWSCYVLSYNHRTRRPEVDIYEPETYFPVLDEYDLSSFPKVVHFAWEFTERNEEGEEVDYVRRITYELVPTGEGELSTQKELELAESGVDIGERPTYLTSEDTWEFSCLLTDATWLADDFENVADMNDSATYAEAVVAEEIVELNRAPIGLDFMPVVMVSNNLTSTEHFGRSALAGLFQLLDELAATDTDEALSSRWAARPPIAASGISPTVTELDFTPGQLVALGEGGSLSTVDMSKALSEIGERISRLLKRLSVNGQVPEGLLGRVDASEVPSGLALTLSFTPFQQMIELMRLARAHKYALLLKMVMRIAVANGDETFPSPDQIPEAELRFGSFMPQDLAGGASIIRALREAEAIGQETAIEMAQEYGAPIEDPRAELRSIRRVMTSQAYELFTSLGAQAAADLLGVPVPEQPAGVDELGGAVLPPDGSTVDAENPPS